MKNLQNMFNRLDNAGGKKQQDRMIKEKKKSFLSAVQSSYQGAKITIIDIPEEKTLQALMNPNRLVADYDEKVLSVEFNEDLQTGTIFKWINPINNYGETFWIVYLQDLTELAYFRADVRRCNYLIKWIQDNQEYSTYAAIKGPKQASISSIAKSSFNMDLPNYDISLLVPKNKNNLQYFKRYTKFFLSGLNNGDTPICWRVEAVDSISLPGVMEIYAVEDFINNDEDDVDNGIIGGLIEPIISQEQKANENKEIVGDNFIKPKFTYKYIGSQKGLEWTFDKNLPIKTNINENTIEITWTASYSGEFVLSYGDNKKTIIVESLL